MFGHSLTGHQTPLQTHALLKHDGAGRVHDGQVEGEPAHVHTIVSKLSVDLGGLVATFASCCTLPRCKDDSPFS